MNIRWNTKRKAEREANDNRNKAHEETKRMWERFARLCKKANQMSVPVLLSKLKQMRRRAVDVFHELGQEPPELMTQLFDEKIAVIQDIKDNPNTFRATDSDADVAFRTRQQFEEIPEIAKAMGREGFAFLLFDDANNILAMDTDEEFVLLGQVKRRSGLPYPSVTQMREELARRPKHD